MTTSRTKERAHVEGIASILVVMIARMSVTAMTMILKEIRLARSACKVHQPRSVLALATKICLLASGQTYSLLSSVGVSEEQQVARRESESDETCVTEFERRTDQSR